LHAARLLPLNLSSLHLTLQCTLHLAPGNVTCVNIPNRPSPFHTLGSYCASASIHSVCTPAAYVATLWLLVKAYPDRPDDPPLHPLPDCSADLARRTAETDRLWKAVLLARHECVLRALAFLNVHATVNQDIKPENEFVYTDESGEPTILVSSTQHTPHTVHSMT
jgi:hypothetical protein